MHFTRSRKTTSWVGRLPLTSLIDVIFLLLIYFMVTSQFVASEAELSASLKSKQTAGGRALDLQPQVIVLRRGPDGVTRYQIGERVAADKAALTTILRQLSIDSGVFVRAAGDVPVGDTAAALQACRDAGFKKVSYVPLD